MSQPVGGEFGLEPLRPELYEFNKLPLDSRDLVSEENYRDGSEFGGVGGLIQPVPHTPTASERLMMVYAIDPTDDGTEDGSILPPELDGNFDPR